jgi:hypothetical protein
MLVCMTEVFGLALPILMEMLESCVVESVVTRESRLSFGLREARGSSNALSATSRPFAPRSLLHQPPFGQDGMFSSLTVHHSRASCSTSAAGNQCLTKCLPAFGHV